MAKANLKLVAPSRVNGTVGKARPPNRIANDQLRGREYLTDAEVSRLKKAAIQSNRHGFRDTTIIMTAYRHGLRVSELCDLRWDQIDLAAGKIHVTPRQQFSTHSQDYLGHKSITNTVRYSRLSPERLKAFWWKD